MNIEARKISLAQRLFLVQQETILDKIEKLLTKETSALTIEQKNAIDLGLDSLDSGKRTAYDEVINETKKRYPNLFK